MGSARAAAARARSAQIPGGTFADGLILGVAVLVIVGMDRIATRRS